MNSRERVLAAVNFQRPDRVPIDLGGTGASGINAVVYDKLKKRIGVEAPTRIHGTMLVMAALDPEVLERLHVDVLPLDPAVACWGRRPAVEGVRKTLKALQKQRRQKDNNTYIRAGVWWTDRAKATRPAKPEVGAEFTLQITPQIIPDIRSVEQFLDASPAS